MVNPPDSSGATDELLTINDSVEYKVGEFMVHYSTESLGWQYHDHPAWVAERWMNDNAADGWRLERMEIHRPTYIVVTLVRSISLKVSEVES